MAKNGKKIIYTSGSWDMFHVGHLNILEKSRALGDCLIVGVSTDELIEEYKGLPPLIPFEERMRIIKALRCVDQAVTQTVLTEIAQLKELDVDVVTIGDDWRNKHLPGLEWIKSQPGKEVVYFEYTPGVSTTGIKKKIIENTYQIISAELKREAEHIEQWKKKHCGESGA